jgi:hypothetical protein
MKKICIAVIATIISAIAFGQDSTVQMFGKILDEDNSPIANVKIVLKGTKYETVTNGKGQYFFMLPAKKGVLIYSHPDYKTKEGQFTGTPQATDLRLIVEKKKRPMNNLLSTKKFF